MERNIFLKLTQNCGTSWMEEYTAELEIHAVLLDDNLVEPQQHAVLVRRCVAAVIHVHVLHAVKLLA